MTATIFQPITDDDRRTFMQLAPKPVAEGGLGLPVKDINFEEVDEHWQLSYAVGDRAGSANAAFPKLVTVEISSAKNEVLQTQDPILKGDANNAGDQLIGMYGLGVRLYRGALSLANMRAIMLDLGNTVVRLKNANNRRQEIFMDAMFSAGLDLQDGVATGQASLGEFRYRKFGAPFTIGKEQKFEMTHLISRSSDWAAAFTLDFWAPTLIARKK